METEGIPSVVQEVQEVEQVSEALPVARELMPMKEQGLSVESQDEIASKLNMLLANEYLLFTKTFKYHWNVIGENFGPLHALFGKQYEQLFEIIDSVAERIRALDGIADGTLAEFAKNTQVSENPGQNPDAMGMIAQLLADHEMIIKQIRQIVPVASKAQDEGTVSFLGSLLEKHEKIAWMLRAHLR